MLYLDLVVNGVLDREKRSSYSLLLEAFDGGSPKRSGAMTLEVSVTDINDHAPVFNQSRYHAIISESLPQGSNILQVLDVFLSSFFPVSSRMSSKIDVTALPPQTH